MPTYTITLTASVEASNEKEALTKFIRSKVDDLNTGENIEVEPEYYANERTYK